MDDKDCRESILWNLMTRNPPEETLHVFVASRSYPLISATDPGSSYTGGHSGTQRVSGNGLPGDQGTPASSISTSSAGRSTSMT